MNVIRREHIACSVTTMSVVLRCSLVLPQRATRAKHEGLGIATFPFLGKARGRQHPLSTSCSRTPRARLDVGGGHGGQRSNWCNMESEARGVLRG